MKKIVKIIGLVLVSGALLFLVINNIIRSSQTAPEEVWDEQTVLGEKDAKNHFVVYTDLSCSYCYRLSSILIENEDLLNDYLAENDVKLEFRVIPYLGSDLSFWGAEAVACAAEDGKFWEFFKTAIEALGDDYFSGDGTVATDSEYFVNLGKKIGVSDGFNKCIREHQKSDQIEEIGNTASRKIGGAGGVPYMKFKKYTSNGFDQSWGWNKLKQMMDAGL